MTAAQTFRLPEILNKYFTNPQDANAVVSKIEKVVENKFENRQGILLTKDDKIDLIDRINKAKTETIIWIVGVGVLQFILSILAKKFL